MSDDYARDWYASPSPKTYAEQVGDYVYGTEGNPYRAELAAGLTSRSLTEEAEAADARLREMQLVETSLREMGGRRDWTPASPGASAAEWAQQAFRDVGAFLSGIPEAVGDVAGQGFGGLVKGLFSNPTVAIGAVVLGVLLLKRS